MENKLTLNNEYTHGDMVFHKASGEKGIVVMFRITFDENNIPYYDYLVDFGSGLASWLSGVIVTDVNPDLIPN